MKKIVFHIGHEKDAAERLMKEVLKYVPESQQVQRLIEQDQYAVEEWHGAHYVSNTMPIEECNASNMVQSGNYFYKYVVKTEKGRNRKIVVVRKTHF